MKSVEKRGLLFDVNQAPPPRRNEDVLAYFLRRMNVVTLRTFLNLHTHLRSLILPILLPSIMGQSNILKNHFSANSTLHGPALKCTPKDVTRLLLTCMDDFARNYIFPSVVKQFLLSIYR